jgi:hypothetical protein
MQMTRCPVSQFGIGLSRGTFYVSVQAIISPDQPDLSDCIFSQFLS